MNFERFSFEADIRERRKDTFSLSGPVHLTVVDWNDIHHRRSVAASLVKGAYAHERDRQNKRLGPEALAPPWWESFGFQLTREIKDDADSSIIGAIYEYRPQASHHSAHHAPKYVVAFRGTLRKRGSWYRDVLSDLRIFLNKLHYSSRIKIAMPHIQEMVDDAGAENIWLAGHSLGSAMALLAGKNMANKKSPVETYLFNQPFISIPIEWIKDPKLKNGIRFAHSFVKVGVASLVKGHHESPQDNPFDVLSTLIPNLFVNPRDHICSGYIGYFKHRKGMEKMGAGKIERPATQNSIGSLLLGALGNDSEALHLLPSAKLTINLSPSQDFKQDHGINQWWRKDIHSETKLHQPFY